MMGFTDPIRAIVIGASGGVGSAMVDAIHHAGSRNRVWATSRNGDNIPAAANECSPLDIVNEASIEAFTNEVESSDFSPNLVFNCSGLLHRPEFGPERSWRHLDIDTMRAVFDVNTFGVALLGKHLIPLLPREGRTIFASLSARVGSIGDNRLGGWYSYRASKAAQNMMIKCLSIEASMRWKHLICVALHPGTVDTQLSSPFSSRVPPNKLFTPAQSCEYLCSTLQKLTPKDTGGVFAWDGQPIEY